MEKSCKQHYKENGVSQSNKNMQGLSPAPLMQLSTAYWDSQTLLTANRMGLFDLLSDGAKTLEEITTVLGTQPRPTRLFLKACVGLDLVDERENNFTNTPLSQTFLTSGSPAYLGNALRYSDNLYTTWGNLEQALKADRPQTPPETYTGNDKAQTRDFVYGMHDRALGIGQVMVELVDLSGRTRMIDVGGGPGTYSALFATKNPALHSRVLDLPEVVAIAVEIVESMGMSERVKTEPLDYMQDAFPVGNDVVLISGVFHRESEQTCRGFIQRAFDALDPGGMLVVNDVFTDAGGNSPLFATLFGLNMLLTAEDGGVHADADVADWMKQQGFTSIEKSPFPPPMPHRIVTGIKP
ncbi:MAG: hypothetical protein DIZ77_16115 [endosymbiont of Seepiophila jonesi]|uniref:Methyltransferase n=1 Tax=endosymbiont of Lamellibrachia luymesi TaxID=2200907 RepID=A0A370E1T8_9GAMM|nr:MAG: hypothetical protein DIZ77_16115 [endosymbiont of Seepiophila jonesi]RDH93486.1 MAG: hypothetical protein DIZ79_00325 [endosymbiont of Lamellibrachia luymesi]